MICTRCGKGFKNDQNIVAHVLSVYHDFGVNPVESFRYAIERPTAVLNMKHLYCPEVEGD